MKACLGVRVIGLLVFLCFFSACAKTQLCGSVYTPDKEPARGLKVLIKAEPGGKSTRLKEDGSFILKGLKPNTIYRIEAICEADNTRARVDNIYIEKGKNQLPENKMLILATHIPTEAREDTTKPIDPGKGRTVPENP
ncbi:MAG: hypothetical protein ACE5K2_08980 [Candidatus Zixiibacteriota bacterium]